MPEMNLHIELKHLAQAVTKLDIVSFNQKGLDFIAGENPTVRRRPLYRILVTASELRWEARVFAAQWGIMIIEPNRLPLLTLHDLATSGVPGVASSSAPEAAEIAMEVPYFIAPAQERLRRIVSTLDSDEAILGVYRIKRMLEGLQNKVGSRFWRLMDKLDPAWIEGRYHSAFTSESCVCREGSVS